MTILKEFFVTFKHQSNFRNQREFITLVFPYVDMTNAPYTSVNLSRSETFKEYSKNDFLNCSSYMRAENYYVESEKETLQKLRRKQIKTFLSCLNERNLQVLQETLIKILDPTSRTRQPNNELLSQSSDTNNVVDNLHNPEKVNKFILYLEHLLPLQKAHMFDDNPIYTSWIDALYYYFYFAVTDELYYKIGFIRYPLLQKDLDEYNEQITLMYGTSGNHGMHCLYTLADRTPPNIIAAYECGELEYYGKGLSGRVNYQKAYHYYSRITELNEVHPLALWSIASMKFHYTAGKSINDSEYIAEFEDALKNGSKRKWFRDIFDDAYLAYTYNCAAAANLLGNILSADKDTFPLPRNEFKALEYKSAKSLYKESADAGYIYGCNNYAQQCMVECKELKGDDDASKATRILLRTESTKYLKKASVIGSAWASNLYGLYCLKGLKQDDKTLITKDMDTAYQYFSNALPSMYVEKQYWAFINICNHFWLNSKCDKYLGVTDQLLYDLNKITDTLKNEPPSDLTRALAELTLLVQKLTQ